MKAEASHDLAGFELDDRERARGVVVEAAHLGAGRKPAVDERGNADRRSLLVALAGDGSVAVTVALELEPSRTLSGQVICRVGGVASTCTVRHAGEETLPTLSATVAQRVCEPLVVTVCGPGIDAGSIPLPGLPSDRVASWPVKETLTLSLYQPPLPE